MSNSDNNNSGGDEKKGGQHAIGRMVGFDPEFRDLDHYIRFITERIWEGHRLDDIYTYYADPCIVETPSSVSTSVEEVVSGTAATLVQFPDRRLLAEDVIQSGDASGGFLSSHRIISTMTHMGDGNFGRASGRKIHVRTIADCVCKDNRIVHEWLVRDQAAIALQIGLAPRVIAQRWLDESGGLRKPVAAAAPIGYRSHVSCDLIAQKYASAIHDFANRKSHRNGNAALSYDEAVHHIGPGNQTRYGQVEVAAFWHEMFSALAVQSFAIEHLAFQQGGGRADRVTLRWRATAMHTGDGRYGAPTGKSIEIMGINHAEFLNGRVLREWVLVDDVALWMQVLANDSKPKQL